MKKTFRLGHAFDTQLNVHISWLWIAPLAVYTLVALNLEPLAEAIMTTLLIFASILLATVARIRAAARAGLRWSEATLFLYGAIINRPHRSLPNQSRRVETAGLAVTALLATVFGILWLWLPSTPLGIEMEIVALFNVAFFVFSLLLRLSPVHDNLLYGILAPLVSERSAHYILTFNHGIMLAIFAASSVFMLGISWLAFGWWFTLAVLLSQLTDHAESSGEYRQVWTAATPMIPLTTEQTPLNETVHL